MKSVLEINTSTIRDVPGLPIGFKKAILRVLVRRIRCPDCIAFANELPPFCGLPYSRHTYPVSGPMNELKNPGGCRGF
jgi:hypothetical protein